MADPYSGGTGTTSQEKTLTSRARTFNSEKEAREKTKANKDGAKSKKKAPRVSELYKTGIDLLKTCGFTLECCEHGEHVKHRILKPSPPPKVDGIYYPADFNPLQDITTDYHFEEVEAVFLHGNCSDDVREFWTPLFRPKAGDSDLQSFAERKLKMMKINDNNKIHEVLDYGQTFDPEGRISGKRVSNPRIWIPDREWFDPKLRDLKFSDVFTIFPEAEREILRLIIGRIGVGRSNHLPPGWEHPIDHTSRMAGVIVGKDAGLGKSTLFNGMTAAFQQVGMVTRTFKSTEDKFGMVQVALGDIAYKDDTSLRKLKDFLGAEETKILITGGLFQVEDKFMRAVQVWPRCTILVNSNDWNSKFAYDLDPGIIDRIKLISTYREYEVRKNLEKIEGTISEGSPDLRPKAHIPYLAKKLGVSQEAIYIWCLRLAADRFWEIISDTSDPSINRLQVEVRYWTTRQRIRFKADVTQALVNGMAFSYMARTGESDLPELTPQILVECLEHFYFLGVDPSGQSMVAQMKKEWENSGRTSTHYYQGLREIRWESVKKVLENSENSMRAQGVTTLDTIKHIMEGVVLRDGFKIGGAASYVIENWENMRFASQELHEEGQRIMEDLSEWDLSRIRNLNTVCQDSWMEQEKSYSPDKAEVFRRKARQEMKEKEAG